MKIKRERNRLAGITSPGANTMRKNMTIAGLIVVTGALIIWVSWMAFLTQQKVTVAVLNRNVYKNQAITEDMFVRYDMLKTEYENLAVVDQKDGTTKKRIMLYSEVPDVVGKFAAYPLMQGDYAQYREFISAKSSNKNTVLYAYPGKEVVSFDIANDILSTYKSYLSPGDTVNIYATYSIQSSSSVDDGYGNKVSTDKSLQTVKSELAFNDIMIADMLNGSGDSVLDLYTYYNSLPAAQQSALDNDTAWKTQTTPSTLLVALSPEELERYYYYKNKRATFECALPQRSAE